MSNADLRTSLRHTHSYIEAYGADLLQDIEHSFRHALDHIHGGASTQPQEEPQDFEINFGEPAEKAESSVPPAEPPPTAPARKSRPEPERIRLSGVRQQEEHPAPAQPQRHSAQDNPALLHSGIEGLPGWHRFLPGIIAMTTSISLLLYWWSL